MLSVSSSVPNLDPAYQVEVPVIDVDTGETITVLMEDEPAPKRLKHMVANNAEAPCDSIIALCCECLWCFTRW